MTAPIAVPASVSSDLVTLSTWMAGDFSNFKQADAALADFAHIRIFFRPLPYEFFEGLGFAGGIGFYSEQVYDYDLWSPYRQGLHRVVAQDGHIYIENYGFKDGVPYAGSGHNADILKTIPPDCAIQRRRVFDGFSPRGQYVRWRGRTGEQLSNSKEGQMDLSSKPCRADR